MGENQNPIAGPGFGRFSGLVRHKFSLPLTGASLAGRTPYTAGEKERESATASSNIVKKTLKIDGMTCVSCENRIERKLQNTPGILSAKVSYSGGTAAIAL